MLPLEIYDLDESKYDELTRVIWVTKDSEKLDTFIKKYQNFKSISCITHKIII